ncbi:hypothetical protein DAEQUDRAFT_442196 [Daedalea quercina L-15889]|uniref:Uncharacterized protein n=1 Tax=Daedalea quercina L-15889 TaxID=1314783 RepID=A0A165N8X5_9APHY|nr:hypothetical protein DAEQUDRAFT_442196 [Daedalea quercina L-15889]
MNFTLDDDASQIIYSAGWAIQGTHSADLDQYFERTFHVAEQDGASVNITFSGSAIAIYGSTGPGHADYTVQFDDDVLPSQSAYASTTQFQQLLFQRDFSSSNAAGTHFVSLKAVFTDQGNWLDLDFLTFTDGNITSGASTTAAVATVTPPYLSNAHLTRSLVSPFTVHHDRSIRSGHAPSEETPASVWLHCVRARRHTPHRLIRTRVLHASARLS